jgi:hypothetical protein
VNPLTCYRVPGRHRRNLRRFFKFAAHKKSIRHEVAISSENTA